MPEILPEIVGYILLSIGGFFIVTASIGIHRMPDFFSRLHPAGISDSISLIFIIAGVACLIEPGLVTVKLVLLGLFALLTGATACHALAKAALHSDIKPFGKIQRKPSGKVKKK